MNILFKSNGIFEQMYSDFARNTKFTNPNAKDIKSKLKKLEFISIAENKTDLFCYQSEMLANTLIKRGNLNIGNIILGEIIKLLLNIGQLDNAEIIVKKAIEISKKQNDKIHIMARLSDLEYIYKQQRKRKELYYVLGQKKIYAKEIIQNYEQNAQNYQTVNKKATSLDSIKIQLARVYTELARLLEYKKPDDSTRALEKAKSIYEEINRPEEVTYLSNKIFANKTNQVNITNNRE